jgi:dTDP-4-amino-4,6-dideoxygalactose transaminase
MSNWNTVEKFESKIAEFYGAKYAVSTDCCTHAIELCLRLVGPGIVSCPKIGRASCRERVSTSV